MFKCRLHPFYNMDGEIGAASESVEVATDVVNPGSAEEAPQAESESSFARRLREHSEKEVRTAREAWEKESGEKYKDYDVLKTAAEFFRERHGFQDLLSMKEEIEMTKLQEKAEANQISPEMQQRLEILEAKAAKGDELEQKQQEVTFYQDFRTNLEQFATEKNANADELHKFMFDNQISNMDLAYKAMHAEQLEQKLATAKEDSIKEYLASKKGPRVEGSTGAVGVQSVDTSKMSWKDVEKHAAARLEASRTPQ